MANYRALVPGGFYSSNPNDMSVKRSIRCNNPWALNDSAWQRSYPGYVGETKPDASINANRTAIYETPEQGVAAGWELLRKYRAAGVTTVGGIIARYGGSNQAEAYRKYADQVSQWTALSPDSEIKLDGDDATLLRFAKAMFRYEAGKPTPLSDEQILYGFNYAREFARTGKTPAIIVPNKLPLPVVPAPVVPAPRRGFWAWLAEFFASRRRSTTVPTGGLTYTRDMKIGSVGDDVRAAQQRLYDLGYNDLMVDGEFGEVTQSAVRRFQDARNLDPDGEIGRDTIAELNLPDASLKKPPLLPPSTAKHGEPPLWYKLAEKDIGFRETGVNRGIERLIVSAHAGQLGDPWCAIGVNAKIEDAGLRGSRSAAARSFETSKDFVRLKEPALGAIATMWRTSPQSGLGHVFFYDGENAQGIRGIGYNEDDQVKRSFHARNRMTGYWWPKAAALPEKVGAIAVNTGEASAGSET